jgi:hypothetical protein
MAARVTSALARTWAISMLGKMETGPLDGITVG